MQMTLNLELGFPCVITFYSISGKFDQILLKIAFNTENKYIFKLIIIKLAVEKMHSYGYTVNISAMMRKMFIILLISNTTDTGK